MGGRIIPTEKNNQEKNKKEDDDEYEEITTRDCDYFETRGAKPKGRGLFTLRRKKVK